MGRIPSCSGRTPCMGRSPCARCSTCFSRLTASLRRRSGLVEVGRSDLVDRAAVEPAVTGQQANGLQMIHCRAHSARRHAAASGDGAHRRPAHTVVVGLISQRDQDSLLRDAQALQRPALRHDDGRHVRAPASCSRPARQATRCTQVCGMCRTAPWGRARCVPLGPTRAVDGPACGGQGQSASTGADCCGLDGELPQPQPWRAGHEACRWRRGRQQQRG